MLSAPQAELHAGQLVWLWPWLSGTKLQARSLLISSRAGCELIVNLFLQMCMVMTDVFCHAAENNVIELPGSLARTQLHVRYKPGTDDVEVGSAALRSSGSSRGAA